MDAARSVASPGGASFAPAARNRKLVRTAEMRIEVANAEEAARKAEAIAKNVGGLVGSMNLARSEAGSVSATLSARVPVDRFEDALAKLRDLGKVKTLQTSVDDVTGAYTDLDARIRNAKREEQEVLKLYDRGGKLADVITVEEKLAQVRGEIEQLDSQMRVMTEQVDLSTITLTLSEKGEAPIAEEEYSVAYHLRGAGRTITRLLQNLLTFAIYFVLVGWVFWLPLVAIIWLIVRRHRLHPRPQRANPTLPSAPAPPPPPAGGGQ